MPSDAKILCIETSSDACSVALNCNGTVIEHYELAPYKHSQFILPMIQKLIAEAHLTLAQLDAIAFGCGPGSFTGVRLAASITQGLACGLNRPAIPVSTLNIMAQGMYEKNGSPNVLVALDAKMGEIYLGAYSLDAEGLMQPLLSDRLVKPEQTLEDKNLHSLNWIGVGDGWEFCKEVLLQNYPVTNVESNFYPHAKYLLPIAAKRFRQGMTVRADQALPVYLREQVVRV